MEIPVQIWCFVDLRSPIMVSGPDGKECDLQNHLEGWLVMMVFMQSACPCMHSLCL